MRSTYLDVRCLVPPEVWTLRGDASWELIDQRLIITLDTIWVELGEYVINDWHKGGQYRESGLRTSSCKTYKPFSQHSFGRAGDLKFKALKPIDAYQYIQSNADKFPYLSTIEDLEATPTWLHADVRNHNSAGIKVVKP